MKVTVELRGCFDHTTVEVNTSPAGARLLDQVASLTREVNDGCAPNMTVNWKGKPDAKAAN